MKKSKKLMALALVLALMLAAAVPVFAAVTDTACDYCGTQLLTSGASYTYIAYVKINEFSHDKVYVGPGICPHCAHPGDMKYSSINESHYSSNCPCGFSYRMLDE